MTDPRRDQVLQAINVQAEFERYGVRLAAGAQPNASGWISCHSLYRTDAHPSAAINVGQDPAFRGLYVDFGERGNGGKPQLTKSLFDVAAEFGPFMTGKDAYYRYAREGAAAGAAGPARKNGKGKGRVVATYDYHDSSGAMLFQVCRMEPKRFLQRRPVTRPDGKGDWIWDLKGITPVPYHLPEIIPAAMIYVCYSPDTEVLTPNGWIALSELPEETSVAQWHPDGNIDFCEPLGRQIFDYEGEMVHVKADWCDLLVTPDHRQPAHYDRCSLKVYTADKLKALMYLPVSGKQMVPTHAHKNIPTMDQVRLIVAWRADGVNEQRGNRVSWNLKKERKKDRLRNLLDKCNISWTEHNPLSTPGWTGFRINRQDLPDQIKNWQWSDLDWPLYIKETALRELSFWDGDRVGSRGIRFFTANKQDADVIAALAVTSGFGCIVRTDIRPLRPEQATQYVVNLVERTERRFVYNPLRVSYQGKVYCLTVPSSFLVTRRNGKTTISGNCEGEKDADRLRSLGLVATCNPMGAGKWRHGYNDHFKGKVIAILPDNDAPGRAHAHDVAKNLHGLAASVKTIDLPGLQPKGDISDWLAAGGTPDQLRALVESTPEWDPASAPAPESTPAPDAAISKTNPIGSLNQRHAVVMLGGKCCVMNEVVDPVFGRPDVTFSSTLDFRNYYGNKTVTIETEDGPAKVPVAKLWLSSPERRQYEGIVFSPGREVNGYYNLYRGLSTQPIQGDWSLMQKHIWEVIADHNEEVYQYLMAWMARLVQDPGGERPGTSIVLRGKQGTGKGCFVSQFGEIFGSHFLHITNPSHLVNRFNQHLKDALLVFVDEALWAGDRTAEGILKGMVTENYFMCEAKGRDAFPVKNHVHLMIASNSQWVVPAGLEERRFMVLDVSDRHMQDHTYFAKLFHQMDHGGREAMLYDLLEIDHSTIDLRTTPRTGALLDQIVHTMSTVKKFWLERLRAGTLLDEHKEWEVFVTTEKLHKAYLEFSDNCGERYKMIDRQFGKEIRALCSGIPRVKRQQLTINDKRTWVLVFPNLEICRQQFEEMVKGKINWEGDVDEL